MRRLTLALALLALGLLAGCGKKAEQASTTGSDSLLASNPVEQPQGNMTPSTQYQGQNQTPPRSEAPPAAEPKTAPAPKHEPKPVHHTAAAAPAVHENPGVMVPAGTPMDITVNAKMSTETVHAGDPWSGVIKDAVVVGTAAPFPAGSTVSGVVEAAKPAQKGDRAMLLLSVHSITVDGKSHTISATSDSMIAGSTRTRNVSTVAGGAAAGALIGHAVGGGKGALIGGLLGAGATTAGVAASKGYQVTLDEGQTVKFHVNQAVAIKE